MSKTILMIAGEASGDLHGANLAAALLRADRSLKIEGLGGHRMRAVGVRLLADIRELGVVGVIEVLGHLRAIWRVYQRVRRRLMEQPPDLIVLIDYPEFNFRVAKVARRVGIPVIYYVSPQVWAWRRGRIKTLSKRVGRMLVIFPFEKELYEAVGLRCEFVGHPLLDEWHALAPRAGLRKQLGIHPDRPMVGLLPGSRRQEILRHLPALLEAMRVLKKSLPDLQVVIAVAASVDPELVRGMAGSNPMDREVILVVGQPDEVLAVSDAAVVASGTATLQAAIHETPMVIVYKVSFFTYLLGRLLIRTKHIGMANLVAQERIVRELVQFQMTPEAIQAEIKRILTDPDYRDRMRKNLAKVRMRLGKPGASVRAAQSILAFLGEREKKSSALAS